METQKYSTKEMDKLCQNLLDEQVVGFPTDTVYGLAIIGNSQTAFDSLVKIKNRPITKPLSVMVYEKKQIQELTEITEKHEKMIEHFLPGAATLIFNAKAGLPIQMTLGCPTIGIRIPNHQTALSVLKMIGQPLLVTSANISGQSPLLKANDVFQTFAGQLTSLIDEDSQGSQASTVIDLTKDKPVILRQGPISKEEIDAVWEG